MNKWLCFLVLFIFSCGVSIGDLPVYGKDKSNIEILTTSVSIKMKQIKSTLYMYPTGTTTVPNYTVRVYTGDNAFKSGSVGKTGKSPNKGLGYYYDLPVKVVFGDHYASNLLVYIQHNDATKLAKRVTLLTAKGPIIQSKRYKGKLL